MLKPVKKFFQQNYPTSNALSEFITNRNHMKFIFELKGIECTIQISSKHFSVSFLEQLILQLSTSAGF
jgi:hypothetical protein